MFWPTQTKLKGLTPAIGASPNFVLPQKVLSDSNNLKHSKLQIITSNIMTMLLACIAGISHPVGGIEITNIINLIAH